ncbi:MAG TPA: TetR/AcrR family transcriptional regulator [Solirubrobacter sp.]
METTGLRERKKERTRATIARVALELFARDGFAATTLAAIAEGADVSPRTVSTYFPSKEGIVFAAYEDAIERLVVRLAAREPGASVVATVGGWARVEASMQDPVSSATVRARVADGPDFARLRQAAIARDPDLWALERGYVRPLTEAVAAAFAEEFDIPADSLAVRLAAETTTVALLEANARAAKGDSPFNALLEDVLAFVRGGVEALRK